MRQFPPSGLLGWAAAALLAASGAAATALYRPRPVVGWLGRRSPRVLYRVPTERRVVALTIDDAPTAAGTRAIAAVLAEHDARATFFLLGSRVPGHEPLVQELLDAGHEIGNHLWADRPSVLLSAGEFERQLRRTHRLLHAFSPVRWFRPGAGAYNARMLAQAESLGYRCVLGSVHPFDPQLPFAWHMKRYLLAQLHPGAILILHDGEGRAHRTAAVLAEVLPEMRRRGYIVESVSGLLERAERAGPG